MHVSNTQEQEPAVYQAIQAFQQENPDVKIELVEHLTEEHNKQLKLWAQSGELPDIFWCQEGDVLEYGENGYLLPLNDFLSQNPDIDSCNPRCHQELLCWRKRRDLRSGLHLACDRLLLQ